MCMSYFSRSRLEPFGTYYSRTPPLLQVKGLVPTQVSYASALAACAKAVSDVEEYGQKVSLCWVRFDARRVYYRSAGPDFGIRGV